MNKQLDNQKTAHVKGSHIKLSDRVEISLLLNKGYSVRGINKVLGISIGSLSEEINKNKVKGIYDPYKANDKARTRRKGSKYQGMKVVKNDDLRNYVEDKLKEDWSPEEISGRIKEIDQHLKYVSTNGVYKFIHSVYGRQLESHLRHNKKKYKSRGSKSNKLQNRIFIDDRPKTIDFGDYEGDLVVSNKSGRGVLIVLYNRKTRYVLIKKCLSRKTKVINSKIYAMTGGLIMFKSLTLDNDLSFSAHKILSNRLGIKIYFCHAYHSWEKGGVENMNKLIRQYIRKKTDISKYSHQFIQEVQDKLNNRPRKCLEFKTPLEVMNENHLLLEKLNSEQQKNHSLVSDSNIQYLQQSYLININQGVRFEGSM